MAVDAEPGLPISRWSDCVLVCLGSECAIFLVLIDVLKLFKRMHLGLEDGLLQLVVRAELCLEGGDTLGCCPKSPEGAASPEILASANMESISEECTIVVKWRG
jgi:hypothetical protein